MRAVEVRRLGGPEVLELSERPEPTAGAGEVVCAATAVGVNFADVYQRIGQGRHATPVPFVAGTEGAGRVVAVGPGADALAVGDRVVWMHVPESYAERVAVPVDKAVRIPEGLDDETACAAMLQGVTAQYLASACYPIAAGDVVLVHAGAGGVGLLLTQMARARGARVIATVSTAEKEALAREAGADAVIRYDRDPVAAAVRELTAGEGVAAVYDGVGAATFEASLQSLRVRGVLVLYGNASGPVPPFDLARLAGAGSLYVTRPTAIHYTRTAEELATRAGEVLQSALAGRLRVRIGARYPLAEAAAAHAALEGRRTTGKVLLLP
jgi:NADPH:quinone reductase